MMSLAEFLEARELSCAEFARTLGVRDTTVLRWAKRDREPSVAWAFAIEKATDGLVPAAAWLMSGTSSSPASVGSRKFPATKRRRSVKGRKVEQAAAGRVRRKRHRSRKQTH